MTKLLDKAVAAARKLPADAQDDIARVLLQLAGDTEVEPAALTEEEQIAIRQSKDAARRGDFATDHDVRAVWRKHGL